MNMIKAALFCLPECQYRNYHQYSLMKKDQVKIEEKITLALI